MNRLRIAVAMSAGASLLLGSAAVQAQGAPPYYVAPGEPQNHGLLSPTMGQPARKTAGYEPPKDPRNFEGDWSKVLGYNALIPVGNGTTWVKPPFTERGEKVFWHRVELEHAGTPVPDAGIQCKPMGLSRAMNAEFGHRYLQSPDLLRIMINEDHLVRWIRIGGKHPVNLKPSYMGDSVAHWEGNTLVIDSIGFNDRTWLDFDGTPHSTQLHIVERLRKLDDYQLEDVMTIEDPVMYTKPWSVQMVYAWAPITAPGVEIICEENGVQVQDYTGKDL
ncbi:MAG TPA: hypothetical protein VMI92_09120 [Steroidobacteraceae bacterium]|nr:hypothetical protein [Steroidobacteraceae bacterium]